MYGLDLVKKSEGKLHRGVIYLTLNTLENAGQITSELVTDRRIYSIKENK